MQDKSRKHLSPERDLLQVSASPAVAPHNMYLTLLVLMHRACFFPLTTMKFRRSLEPHINVVPDGPRKKALKPGGNLLLGFSGGLGSTVLLDLVERSYFTSQDVPVAADGTAKGGRNHPRNEPIWKRTFVCYVEVCAAFPGVSAHLSSLCLS